MSLQNRVDPCGTIFRTSARGTMMGNRGGAIHDERREIIRQYKSKRWITCVLEFRGRRRIIMAPRRYTELFFLDEATAFAAGHRPCFECRRERFLAFQSSWPDPQHRSADEIDAELHVHRIDRRGSKVTYRAPLASLPNGSFVEIASSPYLLWEDGLFLWTPQGYGAKIARPNSIAATVLTPRPIVESFLRGYTPAVHESCRSL